MRPFCISCMGYLCECAVLEVLKGVIGQFCAFGGLSWAALLYRTSCGSKLGTLCISSIVHRVISCDVAVEDLRQDGMPLLSLAGFSGVCS